MPSKGATPTGNSYLSCFVTCRAKFKWRHIYGLQPKELDKNLETGSATHLALADWHISHIPEQALDIARAYLEDQNMSQEWDITEAILKAYFDKFKGSPLQVIIPEFETSIKVGDWTYTMKIDGIAILDHHFYVLEHKTSGLSPSLFFRKFQVDRQVTGYILGAQAQCPDKEIIGVFINGLFKPQRRKTGLTQASVERELVLRTPYQFEIFLRDTERMFAQIEECKGLYEMGRDAYYQNTEACSNFNRTCEYIDLCKYGPKEDLILAMFQTKESEE